MITDNEYIDMAYTVSYMHLFEDGRINQIKAMLHFAELYHQSEIKKLNIPAVIKHSSINQISKKRVKELNALKKYARDQFTVGLIESQIKYWSELQ